MNPIRRAIRNRSKNNAYDGIMTAVYERVGPPFVRRHYGRLTERLAKELPGGARVLDVGSGPGHFLEQLAAKRPDLEVVGIDPATAAIARSRGRCARFANVRVEQAGADATPFDADYFDVMAAMGSYKHWPDRVAGLRELRRILRPGGRFLNYELDPEMRASQMGPVPVLLRPIAAGFFASFNRTTSVLASDARAEALESGFTIACESRYDDLPFWVFELTK